MPACRSSITALVGAIVAMTWAAPTALAAAPAQVGDAFATPGANACSWTIGTDALQKRVVLDGDGRFTLTSFRNELASPAIEYVDPDTASAELRFHWDGATVTGATPGWSCRDGAAERIHAGGAPALAVKVTLARDDVEATKHYVVYPLASQIREWVTYRNADSAPHRLARPSFLEQRIMGKQVAGGDVRLSYMTGGRAVEGSWQLKTTPLTADYQRTFDSYDAFGCGDDAVRGWQDMKTYADDVYLGMPAWHDDSPQGGFVYPAAEHPGPGNDSARAWTAPQDGVVDIASHAAKLVAAGNGVRIRVTKDEQELSGWHTIAGDDTSGLDVNLDAVPVFKGDVIRFEINNNGAWASDATTWDPQIQYRDGGPRFKASESYGGQQGTDGWRYQDNHSDGCGKESWTESSAVYMPWLSFFDETGKDGVFAGFDYYGRWAAPIGARDGGGASLSLEIPNYDHELAPGESMQSPKAFVGVYSKDLDDMTNRLLDWQYRYMWDYTRKPWFAAIRMQGYWHTGSHWGPTGWDLPGTFQKTFGLSDHLRSVGADTWHRDFGWWDTPGNWDGPDWRITRDFLAKSGIPQLIYMPAYDANTDSRVYRDHPDWFETGSPCGYADRLIDLTKPAAEQWMGDLLIGKAGAWGDFQWRNDSCPVGPWDGVRQLAQDEALRRVQQRFLDERPGSALQGVDSGGNEVSWEFMRMTTGMSITDRDGRAEQYDASRLFPADKISGIPEGWAVPSCDTGYNIGLAFNPDFNGDTTDPQRLECLRKLVDTYHYLAKQGVVGRWVHQFHPRGTDADRNWFERLSRDGSRGLIVYKGEGSGDAVTVFPKGLAPDASYDVRFELAVGVAQRSGADLMEHGIELASVRKGELVYLNLPRHPGSGTDRTPPQAPRDVRVTLGVNMSLPGVEVRWNRGSDDNWVAYYDVLRDGRPIGRVAKGRFFFDHTPGASPTAVYAVRTVDGDGNGSPLASSPAQGPSWTHAVDDAPGGGVIYGGSWTHRDHVPEAAEGSLSVANASCHLACRGFSATQGANDWRYQNRFDGQWRDMAMFVQSGYLGMSEWRDEDPLGGSVWERAEHPGPNGDAARAWTAPKDGTVDISGHAAKMNDQGNGVVIRITRDGETVWGPRTIAGNDMSGIDVAVADVTVHAGDLIRFEINNNGHYAYDATAWDPDLVYHGDPPPVDARASATYAFTGSQITWFAKLGTDGGRARVVIDGKPDTTVDLYAPDENSHSVPVYVKTFPTDGPHTIEVSATDTADRRSSGTALTVDGFQVLTGAPVTTEENGRTAWLHGTWAHTQEAEASGGAVATSGHPGDTATFAFIGRQVSWIGRVCQACGKADVYVDGRLATRVDTYGYRGLPDVWRSAVFQRSWPSRDPHVVRIVVRGERNFDATADTIHIDAFQVR